jgi:hypothetical protein
LERARNGVAVASLLSSDPEPATSRMQTLVQRLIAIRVLEQVS